MQVFRLLSHIAPTDQQDEHELAGSRAIKKAQKEDFWKTWAKASASPEDLPWSLFILCLLCMASVGYCTGFWPVSMPYGLDCKAHEHS